jgi:serine/threonine protein kinase
MQPGATDEDPPTESRLRERIARDIAAGRTVSLSAAELAAPELRQRLPQLLEEYEPRRPSPPYGAPRLPGYTILAEIGQGGMSTVYLARHEVLDRHVAVKVVPGYLNGQERARGHLLNEARALAKLRHPHIVTIHDVVESGDTVALAMEWVDGLSLAALQRFRK